MLLNKSLNGLKLSSTHLGLYFVPVLNLSWPSTHAHTSMPICLTFQSHVSCLSHDFLHFLSSGIQELIDICPKTLHSHITPEKCQWGEREEVAVWKLSVRVSFGCMSSYQPTAIEVWSWRVVRWQGLDLNSRVLYFHVMLCHRSWTSSYMTQNPSELHTTISQNLYHASPFWRFWEEVSSNVWVMLSNFSLAAEVIKWIENWYWKEIQCFYKVYPLQFSQITGLWLRQKYKP